MKNFGSLFVALCCTIMLHANGTKIGDLYYILNADGTASVTYETFNADNYASLTIVTIPNTVSNGGQNYTVTAIGNSAFKGAARLQRFEFESGNAITLIDESAFQDCVKLQSFYMPYAKVRTVGKRAFKGCKTLFTNLPASIETIGDYAFAECVRLDAVNFTENLQSIGREAFAGATNLQCVVLPPSLESIGIMAFSGCTALRYFVLRKTSPLALNQDNATFNGVDVAAVELQVPYEIQNEYRNAAVWSQFKIMPYVQQSNIYYVVDDETHTATVTFERYSDSDNYYRLLGTNDVVVDEVVLVNHVAYPVEKIGDYAFQNAFITKLSLPDNVKEIGERAVEKCYNLIAIRWPKALRNIGQKAFSSVALTDVELPDQLQSLDYGAFMGCENLRSVSLPASLTQLGEVVFEWCDDLALITNYATAPQDIADKYVFYELNTAKITLRVPRGTLAAYLAAPVWQDFNIEEFDLIEEAVEKVGAEQKAAKTLVNGQLLIRHGEDCYNLQGQSVK